MEKCLYLILTVLHVSTGCDLVENEKAVYITAYTGDSVLLPCYCTELHTKPERFIWSKYNKVNEIWDVIISSESDQNRNRFQLVNVHSPGNLSLLISHLTKEDDEYYRCALGSSGLYTDIRLTVKGCDLIGNKETVYITARTGDSVLLPCYCTELRAKPQRFIWNKLKENNNWDVIIPSESDQNRNRFQLVNVHSPGNLSLLISHLTEEDGGDYRCYITNENYRDIRLKVEVNPSGGGSDTEKATTSPSSTFSSQSGTTTSPETFLDLKIIGLVAAGALLLLLGLIAVICWRFTAHRKGKMKSTDGKLRRGQETQEDPDVLYSAVTENITGTAEHTQEEADVVLYATINSDTKRTKREKKDDVTYSAVIHGNTSRAAATPVDNNDQIVYASVKLK